MPGVCFVSDDAAIIAPIPDSELTPAVRAALAEYADRNALLRAALADTRARVADLEELADTDPLTPLANRRRFLREMEVAAARAERHGTPAALLWIELEGLKAINDKHGHTAGDAALIHVARLLAGLVRATDHVARVGGDQFALVLDHLDHNSAIETAERVGRFIQANPLDLGSNYVILTAAIGIATILPGDRVDDVLARAHRNVKLARLEN
jgi:diguanylate cyclase (GGDEF)-like protein